MQEQHLSETSTSNPNPPSPEPIDSKIEGDADLRRYGITAHQHTSYQWNGYRYSNASDAIAAAKRAAQ
jgi:hypothetical protein